MVFHSLVFVVAFLAHFVRSYRFFGFGFGFGPPSSGNRAFDEYRSETLRRLEEEQVEFRNFLDRLRHAKDKEEFDQFMAQHKTRPTPPPTDQQQG